MSEPEKKEIPLSTHAAVAVELMTGSTGLTPLQLASAFRIAALICEEQHAIAERLYMAAVLRNFGRPR